jgi:predicted chitinase
VESYFHKGSKYTKVWRDAGQGRLEALTEEPVREADYEYNLYKRAMALYPDCPSDGYEMLRFGRILSAPVTLPPTAGTTWMRVAFAKGQEGYIDVSKDSILKLSDADFPFFKGWKKISEGAGLHSDDGLCDIDALKKILSDTKARETAEEKAERAIYNKEDELVRYVKTHKPIRDALRGFVCEAPSEWDGSHNDAKFRKLKEPGEFYDGNEAGYAKFIKLLESFQFWDKTGLTAGEKLWFFHPMAFVRHFRRCGWLSVTELAKAIPRYPFYHRENHGQVVTTQPVAINALQLDAVIRAQSQYFIPMNRMLRKFGIDTAVRKAHFFAQVSWETAQWRDIPPNRRIMQEWFFGKSSVANPATQYYSAFYGRGIMQLTWAGNYLSYLSFRGRIALGDHDGPYTDFLTPGSPRITTISVHWTASPSDRGTQIKWSPRYDPNIIADNPTHACDSGGFFWISKHHSGVVNINKKGDEGLAPKVVASISRFVNGGQNGYFERQAYAAFGTNYFTDIVLATVPAPIQTDRGPIFVDFCELI